MIESMTEGLHKSRSGLIRALVSVREGRIDDVIISGDFIMVPETYIEAMEKSLAGIFADEEHVAKALEEFYRVNEGKFQCPETHAGDFTAALMKAIEQAEGKND